MKVKIIFVAMLLILATSCAYFNTFYNAEKSFESANDIINEMHLLEQDLPSSAKTFLDDAISNSNQVIQKFPKSKYIDDAYYIIGVSLFLKGNYSSSNRYIEEIIKKHKDSEFYTEALLWNSYNYLRLEQSDLSNQIIDSKINYMDLKNRERYLYHNIQGEMALLGGDVESVYAEYEEAVILTKNKSEKVSTYNKMIRLCLEKDVQDYDRVISYLDEIQLYIDDVTKKHDMKIYWIVYNKMLGNYDILIQEIQKMLLESEYQSVYPRLMIELAKTYREKGDANAEKEIYQELLYLYSNTSSVKEDITEAYYRLSQLEIVGKFNLEVIVDYLKEGKKGKGKYKTKCIDLYNKVNELVDLIELYELYGSDDSNDSDEEFDLTLFKIGQSFYFDFNRPDSARSRYNELLIKFPDSEFYDLTYGVLESIDMVDSMAVEESLANFELVDENPPNEQLSLVVDSINDIYNETLSSLDSLSLGIEDSELLFYKAYIKHNLDIFSDIFAQYKVTTGHAEVEEDEVNSIVNSEVKDSLDSNGTQLKIINQDDEFTDSIDTLLDQLDIAIQNNNIAPYLEITSSLENLYNKTGNLDFWFYSAYINDVYANNAERSIQGYISFYNNSNPGFDSHDYAANRLSELYYMLTKQLGHYNINKLITELSDKINKYWNDDLENAEKIVDFNIPHADSLMKPFGDDSIKIYLVEKALMLEPYRKFSERMSFVDQQYSKIYEDYDYISEELIIKSSYQDSLFVVEPLDSTINLTVNSYSENDMLDFLNDKSILENWPIIEKYLEYYYFLITNSSDLEENQNDEEKIVPNFENLKFDNMDFKGLDLFNKSSKPDDNLFPPPNEIQNSEGKQ